MKYFTLIVAAFAAACSYNGVAVKELGPMPVAQAQAEPQILTDLPERPYREIAILSKTTYADSDEEAVQKVIAEAQKIGADAIVRLPTTTTTEEPVDLGYGRDATEVRHTVRAIAVVFIEGD